jgi:hypothetical protein
MHDWNKEGTQLHGVVRVGSVKWYAPPASKIEILSNLYYLMESRALHWSLERSASTVTSSSFSPFQTLFSQNHRQGPLDVCASQQQQDDDDEDARECRCQCKCAVS